MAMSPRLLRPRATGFNPGSLSGLWAWWDAADDSTITTDTGVSVWRDKSPAKRQATQAVGNDQPTRTQTINGKKVLSFDGTNHNMTFSGEARTVETLFAVCQQRDATADAANGSRYGVPMGSGGASRGMRLRMLYADNAFQVDLVYSGFTAGTNRIIKTISYAGSNGDIPLAVYSVVRKGASGFQGFINSQSLGTATTSESQTADRIGRALTSEYFIGELAEVIIYSRDVTDSERAKVTDYLVKKWAIPTRTYTIA